MPIEAHELRKTYPPDGQALDGLSLSVAAGHDLRPARPQRRRQVDDGQDPHDAHAARQRQRARRRASTCSPIRCACAARSASSARSTGFDPRGDRAREPRAPGRVLRDHRARAQAARRRTARALRPRRRRRPAGQDLLGRHAAPARHRAWACCTARRSCSSTSRRPGSTPRRAPRCGARSSGSAREERMTILLTTHYLEEADQLASQLAIVDRGRIVAEGTPDELKSAARGRLAPGRARRRPATPAPRAALERRRRPRRARARRPHAARARARRRRGDPGGARRARRARRAGRRR